jgi:hypothetical protein
VITTLVDADTAAVVRSIVALVAPDGTNTVCGSVTRLLADDSETVTPPAGAADASVRIARVGVPPTIDAAFSASADSSAVDAGVTGDWHALASSAAEARDTIALRSFMMAFLLIAVRAS